MMKNLILMAMLVSVSMAGGEPLRTVAGAAPGYSFFSAGDSAAKFWRCD